MIVEEVYGNIFKGNEKSIFFGVNVEGFNDSGFAGHVVSNYWPELNGIGINNLGTLLVKETFNKTLYAIVCHSIIDSNTWKMAPGIILSALNSIDTNSNIATITIGGGLVGKLQNADVEANIDAMRMSNKNIVLYHI